MNPVPGWLPPGVGESWATAGFIPYAAAVGVAVLSAALLARRLQRRKTRALATCSFGVNKLRHGNLAVAAGAVGACAPP